MLTFERYVVAVNGQPASAAGLSRLSALAYVAHLLRQGRGHRELRSVAVHEVITSEPRACWVRAATGWSFVAVNGWAS